MSGNRGDHDAEMCLDYTKGCVNFRDVGEWINLIAGRNLLPTRRILRGGKLDFVETAAEIGNPGTIISLRNGPENRHQVFGTDYFHFPTSNDLEKYETKNKEVRRWLNRIFATLEKRVVNYPILIHCASGKDRTGVVVAALLRSLGLEKKLIVEEYLLSDGRVEEELIVTAIDGLDPLDDYFNHADLKKLRTSILG